MLSLGAHSSDVTRIVLSTLIISQRQHCVIDFTIFITSILSVLHT